MKRLLNSKWKITTAILLALLIVGGGTATAVDGIGVGLWVIGETDPSDGDILLWNTANNRAEFSERGLNRAFQIKGCSLTSDITNDITAQEPVAFTGGTLCVAQFDKTSGDVGTFGFELPEDYGFNSTTAFTYHVWAITQTESSGTLVVSIKAATSLAGLASASAVTSTVTFTASDTVTPSDEESDPVTIYDAVAAEAGDWVIIQIQTTAASTVDEEPFIEDIVGTYSGV